MLKGAGGREGQLRKIKREGGKGGARKRYGVGLKAAGGREEGRKRKQKRKQGSRRNK